MAAKSPASMTVEARAYPLSAEISLNRTFLAEPPGALKTGGIMDHRAAHFLRHLLL
jgi:hypothetical protein